ncbi:MAG: DUF1667 domain-containing protein [bacterium]|nr:DUF1667 domain-containing protein [bacterium]
MIRDLTCIVCPKACKLKVEYSEKGIERIQGVLCKKGQDYVREEIYNPTRVLTSSVRVMDGDLKLVSVKTNRPIPKDLLMKVMDVLYKTKVKAPIKIGDILIKNILGSGIDIVATKNIKGNG